METLVGTVNTLIAYDKAAAVMLQQLLMKKKAVERIVFLKVVWLACITLVIL